MLTKDNELEHELEILQEPLAGNGDGSFTLMASIQDNEEIGPAAQIRQIKLLASCWRAWRAIWGKPSPQLDPDSWRSELALALENDEFYLKSNL